MASRTDRDIAIRLSLRDEEATRRKLVQLGDDGQKALAKIERQAGPASKGLLAVNAVAGELRGGMAAAAGRLGAFGAALGALGPAGLAVAASIAVVVTAFGGLVRASARAAAELATIKDEAQQAGTLVETYQAMRYAAEEYSVSQSALTDGLKELNLRADEFVVTGGGSAAEAFRRLGFTQDELNAKLGDTGSLFLEVVRRMQSLESEAARIRVADEIFGGTGGEQFVRMVAAGEVAIQNLMRQARDLGYVLDESLIERADETRDRLTQLQRLIDLQLNSAFVDLAPVVLELASAFAEVAKWVAETVDSFRDLDERSTRGLEKMLVENRKNAAELESEIAGLQARIEETARVAGNPALAASSTASMRKELQQLRADYELVLAGIVDVESRINSRQTVKTQPGTPPPARRDLKAEEEAERARKKVAEAIADLEFEMSQIGNSDFDQKVAQKLRSLGLEIEFFGDDIVGFSDERAAKIYELMRQIDQAAEGEQRLTEAQKAGAAMTERLRTAEEERAESLAQVQRLLDAGTISEEIATRRRAEIQKEFTDTIEQEEDRRLRASTDAADGIMRALQDIQKASTDTARQWEDDIHSMNRSARNAFVDITTGAKTMAEGLADIFTDLQRRLAGQIYDRAVGSILDGFVSGLFSGGAASSGSYTTTSVGTLHSGGVVGRDSGPRKSVPASLFATAPRYHGGGVVGLEPDEEPIVAKRGEVVGWPNQMRAAFGSPPVSVQVIDQRANGQQAQVTSERGPDGRQMIRIMIRDEVREGIAQGSFDGAFASAFGVSRRGAR
jgi:hypothetical protein